MEDPPPMPRESMSLTAMGQGIGEGEPPGRAPPVLPSQRPVGPSQASSRQQQQQQQQPQPQPQQQRRQRQPQPQPRQQRQASSLPPSQTNRRAAAGISRDVSGATGCVTQWSQRRLLTFLAGLVVGVGIPLAFAAIVWGSKTFAERNETAALASQLEASNSTLWDRTIKRLEENPANSATGAVLFASLFFVWAHGGGTEIAWVSRALATASSVEASAAQKRRSVTTEILEQKSRAVGWGSAVWAFAGAIFGVLVVLAVLASNTRDGGTMFLSTLLGAGTLGPLASNFGSQLDVVDRGTAENLRNRYWLSAVQAYSRPSRCFASCCHAIASLPCWCGLFKVPSVSAQGEPVMVPSPRMLVTWIGVVLGAGIFLAVGIAITATVSESKEPTLAEFIGFAGTAALREGNSTAGEGSLEKAWAWVRHVDAQLAPHFRQLRRERDALFENDMTQVLLLALCSLVWDIFVIYYHLSRAPHPKFRMRFLRRLSIYTHIWAGVTEIVVSVFAFILYCEMATEDDATLVPSSETCTEKQQQRSVLLVYGHVFCAVAHMVTAAYQTPQVFGMQLVMVPAYSAVVLWKAICVIRLALNPNSLWLLLQLFFVHHIYVWCRAMHVIFEELGIFTEHRYSVSIMFAGLICGPICLGPAANISVITVVTLVGLLRMPYKPRQEQLEWLVEKRSNMLLNERYRTQLREIAGAHTEGLYNLAQSADPSQYTGGTHTIYAPLHADMMVTSLLVEEGSAVTPGQAIATLGPTSVGSSDTSATGRTKERTVSIPSGTSSQSKQDRARMIFDALDDDRDGVLQREEMIALLLSWGIPQHEALECFRSYDVAKSDQVTFAQFYTDWEPVWRFQLSRVDEALKQFFHFSEAVARRATIEKSISVEQRNTPRPNRP